MERTGKMAKKGIIFDMDGTLWDSAEGIAMSWTRVVAQNYTSQRIITADEIRSVMGKTMDKLAEALFPELPEERRMKLLDDCCEAENAYLREHGGILYDGLEPTWEKLKENYSLYIVSNCQKGYIEAFLDHYGFWDYFEDIECYGNNGLKKGDNIRKVVKRNALEDAVYVGDIQGDYEASTEAGVKFIHAGYGFGEVAQEVPVIRTFPELAEVVREVF